MVWPVTNWLPSMRMARSTPLRISGSPPLPINLVSAEPRPGFAAGADQLTGDQQAPGGGVDEQRRRFAEVLAPVALADLVGDQAVGGLAVGNAQQRFGQAHQRHALFRRQREFVHQCVHAGGAGAFCAHLRHQLVRQRGGIAVGARALRQQPFHRRRLVAPVGRGDRGAQRRLLGFDFCLQGGERDGGEGRGGGSVHR